MQDLISLPTEIFDEIFIKLDPQDDVRNCQLVSSAWGIHSVTALVLVTDV